MDKLKPYIISCQRWNEAEDWLAEQDAKGYSLVLIEAEMYQGTSTFNIVMRLNRRQSTSEKE